MSEPPHADRRREPLFEQPLIPELDACRAGYRWARGEIRSLAGTADEETWNRRPERKRWSAAECVEHLLRTGEAMLPGIDGGIREAREKGWLGHGPFEYGRLGEWFVRQSGADELPPGRRLKAPKLYAPEPRVYPRDAQVERFLELQVELVDRLQLASGIDLARVKVASPVTSLLKLSLGQWFRLLEGHQRRHLWQARRALEEVAGPPE